MADTNKAAKGATEQRPKKEIRTKQLDQDHRFGADWYRVRVKIDHKLEEMKDARELSDNYY